MNIGPAVYVGSSGFVSGLLNEYSESAALLLFCILPMLFFLIGNASSKVLSGNRSFQLAAFAMLVPFWYVLY